MQRVGANHVEAPGECSVTARRNFLVIARHKADHAAVRALVVIFAHGAIDVFHVNLAIELGGANRCETQFKRGHGLGVTARKIVVQEHERIHRAEFQFLAANHAFFNHISPKVRRFDTDAVVHEILHVVIVNAVALVGCLLAVFRALLFCRFGAFGRATGFRIDNVVKEPSVQRAHQEVITEYAGLEPPMQTIVVRGSAQGEVVRRDFQIRVKTAQLHIAHRVVPQGVGINRHANVEFARLVGKVCLEVAIVPGFDILAERRFHQEMEILVARTKAKRKERFNMFFVAATVFERHTKPTPIVAIILGRIDSERRVSRTTVKPEIKIRTNLEIALVRRRIRRFCKSQSRSKST